MVRIKHRYLLLNILYPAQRSSKSETTIPGHLNFHAPTPQHVNSQAFVAHLRAHLSAAFGDHGLGVSLSSLRVVYFSRATSTVILRVPRAHHRVVWAALSYMNEMPGPAGKRVPGLKCVVRVVRVSGTIRKAEEELLRRSRESIVKAKSAQNVHQVAALSDPVSAKEHNMLTSMIDPQAEDGVVSDDEEQEGEELSESE